MKAKTPRSESVSENGPVMVSGRTLFEIHSGRLICSKLSRSKLHINIVNINEL